MTWLLEDPTPVIAAAVLIEALLAVALVRTGRGVFIAAMVGVLLAALAGLAIERLVVTERERVEQTLDAVTSALEANDPPRVLEWIDPSAGSLRAYVSSILPRVRIREAEIEGDLAITVNRLTSPASAKADFDGRVMGAYISDLGGDSIYIRHFTVDLRLIDGRWLIAGYEDREFRP